jgi:hypothetical protein
VTCDNGNVRWSPALLIPLLVCTTAVPSWAQGRRPLHEAVRVTGAEDCLHHEAVVERLARWLGARTVDDRVEVTLDVALNAFEISRADEVSRRALGALPGACEDRLDAVTLAMALAIDHTLAERLELGDAPGDSQWEDSETSELPHDDDDARPDGGKDAPLPRPQVKPSPPASMETEVPGEGKVPSRVEPAPPMGTEAREETDDLPPTEDDLAPAGRVRAGAFVEAGAALHVVPGWRAAVAGGALMRIGTSLSTRLGGFWMSEGTAPLGPGTAGYRLWAGRADLCGERALGQLALGGCAGMAVGRLTIEGRGFEEDRTARQLWVAAIGRASASYVAGRARVGLAADLFAPVLRRRAHVEDRAGGVLHDRGPAPVATVLWLTASMTLR